MDTLQPPPEATYDPDVDVCTTTESDDGATTSLESEVCDPLSLSLWERGVFEFCTTFCVTRSLCMHVLAHTCMGTLCFNRVSPVLLSFCLIFSAFVLM
jgi:hypothetical protein